MLCFSTLGRLPRDRKRPSQLYAVASLCLKLKTVRGIMPTPFVARELEDGRVDRVYREPKIKRNSDAAEEPQVRGVLKS